MGLFDALDSMGIRVDGESASMFFARELEHVKAQSYDVIKAPLRAFDLIPVSNEAGPGAESIVYDQFDMVGIAKVISNYADDLPRADVKGKEFVAKVKSIGNSYGYSLQEIRNAQMARKNLQQRKANAAVRAQREAWNRIAFYGDAEYGLQGWLGNPNIPSAAVAADGTGSSTLWSAKTADQIVRDINALVNQVVTQSNGAELPDTLLLPLDRYGYITTTPRSANSDTTIAQFVLANNPHLKSIEWSNEILNANRDANMSSDPFTGEIMIAYRRDPDAFTLEIPQMFEQLPVQERGLEFVVPCHSRIGGVIIYYPMSMAIGEGI